MTIDATTEKTEKADGVNLNELQQETEKLLSLLKDRQPGMMSWNMLLHERVQRMNELISQALGTNTPQERLTPREIMEKFGYDRIGLFREGLTVAEKNDEQFHIRPDGTPAYNQRYDYVGPFYEGLARAGKNGEEFHIRLDGTPAYSQRYDYVFPFHEGLAVVEKNGKQFHIRPDGIPAYDQRYDWVGLFHKGLATARKNGEWFRIRPNGTRVE